MADQSVVVRALVSQVADKNAAAVGSGTQWLKDLRDSALQATLAGDEFVTSVAYEGGSSSFLRGVTSQALLEICQLALEEVTGERPASVLEFDRSHRYVSL